VDGKARRVVAPEVAEFAESPDAFTVPGPAFRRFLTDRYSLLLGPSPHFTSVQRLRLVDVEADVAEIRALASRHGHHGAVWWVGAATAPPDLHDRLVDLGARPPSDRVADLTALATTVAPEPGPPDVDARPVASLDELVACAEIGWDAFGTPPHLRAAERERLEEAWDERTDVAVRFVAFVDGLAAGQALGVYCPRGCLLVGGATRPGARGRGAYRALVRARWDEAVRRGTPTLVTQAAPTSEPILRRLGFVEVCRLRRLEDPS
jgi:hypothetical protein